MLRYAITDGTLQQGGAPKRSSATIALCAKWAAQGLEYVLVREKTLGTGELVTLCREIAAAVRVAGGQTRVLVAGGRVDVALAAHLNGVHLASGPQELGPREVRRLMPQAWVSVSCHTLAEVVRARDAGASAVLFGPVFGKTVAGVEVVPETGLERLREACAIGIPVFAIGGVTRDSARDCILAGVAGIAGIRIFAE